ncbi:hypothetical protein [Fluviispira multicolorata]|nr:hypothetical protein [Fluviispira multicolorata]
MLRRVDSNGNLTSKNKSNNVNKDGKDIKNKSSTVKKEEKK